MNPFFASGGQCIRASISLYNEYSEPVSFRIDWFNVLAVQGTLKSTPAPQFESINFLVLSFFMVQLAHLYMTAGKTIVLTVWTFVSKVTYLLFKTIFLYSF